MSSVNLLSNFLSRDYIQYFKGKMYHINTYKFKCDILASALFSPAVLPFVSNLFIFEPQKLDKGDQTVITKLQYETMKYRFAVAEFPKQLIGKKFNEAVLITMKSIWYRNERFKNAKNMKLILIGIVLEYKEKSQMYTPTILNPGDNYVIKDQDKAYILFQDKGDYYCASRDKIDVSYAQ